MQLPTAGRLRQPVQAKRPGRDLVAASCGMNRSESTPPPEGTDPDAVIARMIWYHPSLFCNRSEALAHLFCVPENGYHWVDGCLVPVAFEIPSGPTTSTDPPPGLPEDIAAEYVTIQEAALERELAQQRFVRDHIDELTRGPGRLRGGLPPRSTDCWLYNLPEGITPAWREVAEQSKAVFDPIWELGLAPHDPDGAFEQRFDVPDLPEEVEIID